MQWIFIKSFRIKFIYVVCELRKNKKIIDLWWGFPQLLLGHWKLDFVGNKFLD